MISYHVEGWKKKVNRRKARFAIVAKEWSASEKFLKKTALKTTSSDTIEFDTLVLDLNGTITIGGKLVVGVEQLLKRFSEKNIRIVVLTGNVRGTGETIKDKLSTEGIFVELVSLNELEFSPNVLQEDTSSLGTAEKKLCWMLEQKNAKCAFIGNGEGDVLVAGVSEVSFAVEQSEGVSTDLLRTTDAKFSSILDALNSLLDVNVMKATLHS